MSPKSIARAAVRGNDRDHSGMTRKVRTTTGRVYIACPLSTMDTPRYNAMLARVRELVPDADFLPARDLFASNAEWRARWSTLLATLDAVIFFDDDDGCIGAGTEQEITDAWLAGIPVFFLPSPPFDALIPCDASGSVEFWPVFGSGMKQTQRVCYAVPATEVLAMMRPASKGGA